jgi:molecular chaperone GrpE
MHKEPPKDWKAVRDAAEADDTSEAQDFMEEHQEALAHPDYAELEAKLTEAEQQAFEYREKCVRALADAENARRRAQREVEEAHRYALRKFVDELLPVFDSIEQALEIATKEGNTAMQEGLALTQKLLHDSLGKFDITQLNPVGEAFNPQEHEAMTVQDVPGAAPNSVVAVFQKGYRLADRVVRPARVIVAPGKN